MTNFQALIIVNAITFSRVPFIVLFMILALLNEYGTSSSMIAALVALVCLIIAALTDLFDGLLARRWNVSTNFGAMADPLMDKVFYLVVFPTLLFLLGRRGEAEATHALIMLIFTVLYIMRDQWVSFLRSIGASVKADVRANWMGKLRTAISFPIGCVIYFYIAVGPKWLVREIIYLLEAVGIIVNLASIVVYTRQYLPHIKQSLRRP